jgi:glycosyltransferase involved in cell wall biosynthesis
MKRIGIDCRVLSEELTGIGHYLFNVLTNLLEIDKTNQYYLYSHQDFPFPDYPNCHKRIGSKSKLLSSTWWLFTEGHRLIKQDSLDVFWAPWPFLPPWKLAKKIAIIVPDLTWKRYPQTIHWKILALCQLLARHSIHQSDVIFVISLATQDDLKKFYPNTKAQIHLAYNGLNKGFVPMDRPNSSSFISKKYKCSSKYILNVGTVEPRKNILTLLKAFHFLKSNFKVPHELLIAGAKGWKNSEIYSEYKKLNLENDVKFLGYIPQEDVSQLYSGAEVFVFPSLYEGFGFPVLEAMACGCPVVASNVSSIPEVLGDAGILIDDPKDHEAFANQIYALLKDEKLRNQLITKGLERAKIFSWDKTAQRILEVFTSL